MKGKAATRFKRDPGRQSDARPWKRPGWIVDRIREFTYQGLSWPYGIAMILTAVYALDRGPITRDAMLGMWVVCFGKRLGDRGLTIWQQQNGGGKPNPDVR